MGYLLGRPSGSQLRTTTDSEEEDSDDEPQEGLGSVKPGILEPCKMVSGVFIIVTPFNVIMRHKRF